MIEELRIRDLGVINDAVVAPHRGLTVVTGETGAGKTMIVTGLGLLLGDRAEARSVRNGTERAVVEGRISVPAGDDAARLAERVRSAGGDLDDDELVVARHITAAGRSRAFLGGAQVPVSVCAEVTTELVAIHGQSEQVRLAAPGRQRELLDAYAGTDAGRGPRASTGGAGPSTATPGPSWRRSSPRAPSGRARSSCCASGSSRSSGWLPRRARTSR